MRSAPATALVLGALIFGTAIPAAADWIATPARPDLPTPGLRAIASAMVASDQHNDGAIALHCGLNAAGHVDWLWDYLPAFRTDVPRSLPAPADAMRFRVVTPSGSEILSAGPLRRDGLRLLARASEDHLRALQRGRALDVALAYDRDGGNADAFTLAGAAGAIRRAAAQCAEVAGAAP